MENSKFTKQEQVINKDILYPGKCISVCYKDQGKDTEIQGIINKVFYKSIIVSYYSKEKEEFICIEISIQDLISNVYTIFELTKKE